MASLLDFLGPVGIIAGGLIGGKSTKDAQNSANDANARAQAEQNRIARENFMYSRGVDPSGNTVNSRLPLWSTINGTPSEQYLLNNIFQSAGILPGSGASSGQPALSGGVAEYNSLDNINKFLETPKGQQVLAEINAAREGSDDPRSPAEWLRDHVTATEQGNGTFSNLLKEFVSGPAGANSPVAPTGPSATPTLAPQAIQDLQNAVLKNTQGIFNGDIRNEELAAMQPVFDTNTLLGGIQAKRNAEMRTGSQSISDAEMAGLADLLGVRKTGLNSIYDDAVGTAGNVYGARTGAAEGVYGASTDAANNLYAARGRGAQDVYGADLKYADTYKDAALQALQRVLAQQGARNAIKGFEGASSGDALLRARTLAGGYQQSAGVRANAGQSLAQTMAKAGESQAFDLGTAGITRAGSLGQAGISKAQDIGKASGSRTTGLAGANEMDAIGRMTSNVNNVTRKAGIFDSDAEKAALNARLQNETSRAGIVGNDITRRLNSAGAPARTYSDILGINNAARNEQFAGVDNVLKRLGLFTSTNSTPPTPGYVPVQPNINTGQIIGSTLGQIGQGYLQYQNNRDLINALRGPTGSGVKTGPGYNQWGGPED